MPDARRAPEASGPRNAGPRSAGPGPRNPGPAAGRFAQYLLPGIVFQSVLIGGAYATGREIVEYGARFGPVGTWSILAIFLGFSLMCVLAFEFARVAGTYDYRSFMRELIGPAWPLFDALYVVMAVIVIAVVGAASGSVVEAVLGLPYWVGVAVVIVLVGALNAAGRRAIERFKTWGSVLLYLGYLVFAGVVLARFAGNVVGVFEIGTRGFGEAALEAAYGAGAVGGAEAGAGASAAASPASRFPGALEAVLIGVLYVGYNLATLPATFFTLDRQTARRQTLTAGVVAGLMATVPFVLTYLAVMAFYPDPAVLGADVPWLVMLRRAGGSAAIWVFGVVLVWTMIETSTGVIHAIVDRIAVNLRELDRPPMSRLQVGTLTVGVLLVAALLSRLGLIALVARGYTWMAYGFLVLFAVPLLTVGLARIVRSRE